MTVHHHLQWARDMKEKYPKYTKGMSDEQVRDIWEEYSDSLCAGWLIPDGKSVKRVMNDFRKNAHNYSMADSFMDILGYKRLLHEWESKKKKDVFAFVSADNDKKVKIFKRKKNGNELIGIMTLGMFHKQEKKEWKNTVRNGKKI